MVFHLLRKKVPKTSSYRGFTLIEVLVGSAIFLIIALSGYRAFVTIMDAVGASQAKIAATSVANERFEVIRNLPYDDVGLVGGLPVGTFQREETITRNNYVFDLLYTIRSTDDPFDGTIGGSPNDSSPSDYKLIDLDITCEQCKIFPPLKFTTIVAPHSLETASTNGALFIQVFDANGLPVPGAEVHIENTNTNPDTIIDETTDNEGWIKIVDAPPGVNAYNIIASKNGYSTEETYPIGGDAGVDPLHPDATVVVQQVTQTSFSIDRLADIEVTSTDNLCLPLANIDFSLTGSKLIGNPDILKYDTTDFTTDALGTLSIQDLEWDNYAIAPNGVTYDIAGINPFPNFSLLPGETLDLNIVAVPHLANAILISIEDENGLPLQGASVTIEKDLFNETKITGISAACTTPGQVFWNGLTAGNYNLTVTKSGYQDYTTTFDASSYMIEKVTLTP
jgi:prepilin-type N-terminal cleavage/methylation domain-containing protein